jgi:hypothetical protein
MDNQTMPQNTMPPAGQPAPVAPDGGDKSVGALIGSIIIVIILIIGGYYLWSTKVAPVTEPTMMEGTPVPGSGANEMTAEEQALSQPDAVLNQMAAVGSTDEVSDIEADLSATNMEGIDSELQVQ